MISQRGALGWSFRNVLIEAVRLDAEEVFPVPLRIDLPGDVELDTCSEPPERSRPADISKVHRCM